VRAPVLADEYGPPLGGALGTVPRSPAPGTVPRFPGQSGFPQRPDQQRKRSGAAAAVIVGTTVGLLVLACFLVVSLSGGLQVLARGGPTPTPTTPLTTIPDFTGMQFTQAQALAAQDHLKLAPPKSQQDQRQAGLVLAQDPPAGQHVKYDTVITLTISAGPGPITVPDVRKKNADDACNMLSAVGLTCNVSSRQPSATVPLNAVISTDPPPGTKIDPTTGNLVVNMVVSSGPPPTDTPGPATATPTPKPTCGPGVTPTPGGPCV
jgi:serine/threonine-protein kinase